jgi:hypothetical protein
VATERCGAVGNRLRVSAFAGHYEGDRHMTLWCACTLGVALR